MKRLIPMLALCATATMALAQALPSQAEIRGMMRKVADWQILHQPQVRHAPTDWTNGALYIGMLDWGELAEATEKDTSYTRWIEGIGNGCRWQPHPRANNPSHADNFTACQAWLRLYQRFGGAKRLEPTQKRVDSILAKPPTVSLDLHSWKALERWSWCDALYMAPQVYAQLWVITKDAKYLDFMHKEFKATTDYLYDKGEALFYRDSRYFPDAPNDKFPHREANGAKVFWGRGNGWVIGGLANLLRVLPKDAPNRAYYEDLYRQMSARLVKLQNPDGYWHASLLDPASYPSPETSASGFIVYALAWGINEGYLDRATYQPAVLKGWKALCDAVQADGKLGYVQPIGQDPRKVTKDMTEVYGVGAFLQAGTQLHRLVAPQAK